MVTELLATPLFLEAVSHKTISLLTTYVRTRSIGVGRETVEHVLKSLSVSQRIMAYEYAIKDILLATSYEAKVLAGSIPTTKSVRLQTEYLGTRKTRVTLLRVPLIIEEGYLGAFFAHYGQVREGH